MVCLLFCMSLHMSTIECHELQKKYIRWIKTARSELVALPSSSFRRGFVHASHPFPHSDPCSV